LYNVLKYKNINFSSPVVLEINQYCNKIHTDPEKESENTTEKPQNNKKMLISQEIKSIKELVKKTTEVQNHIIKKTQKDAELILINAKNEAEKILNDYKNKGYEEGYKEGYHKGFEKGELEANSIIEEAKHIKEDIIKEKERLYKEFESDMISLIVQSVEKIIDINLEENKDLILNLIKKGLENYNNFEKVTVRISENDYENVIKNKEKLLRTVEFIDDINIIKDLSLKKGDCIIDTNSGVINSGIYTQLEAFKNIIVGVLNE